MLKSVCISNLALIERADIDFHTGFNAITGETGAGKSALLNAMKLLSGEKSDNSLLRTGADKGWVEALFDCSSTPSVEELLTQSGIENDPQGLLVVKRELCAQGRGRIFINHQLVQRALLQNVMNLVLQIVGQHASRILLNPTAHRTLLDKYGGLEEEVSFFGGLWLKARGVETRLRELVHSECERNRTLETLERELTELDDAKFRPGEEEELFAEYTRLTNAELLASLSRELTDALEGEKLGIINNLARHQRGLDKLLHLEPSLKETALLWRNACIELREVAHSLHQYNSRLASDPDRSHKIDERLRLIGQVKRKYGADSEAIALYRSKAEEKLNFLRNCDLVIEELQKELLQLNQELDNRARAISEKRHNVARTLGLALTAELQALNMAGALITIGVTAAERGTSGDDTVEILLTPNQGEKEISLRHSASGGELSRVLLALHCLLADKEGVTILVFDEVDANIGGETASLIGAKLREIGSSQQVLCITHFPQVAAHAHHHLLIAKSRQEGRTITTVKALHAKGRKAELTRMGGGVLSKIE